MKTIRGSIFGLIIALLSIYVCKTEAAITSDSLVLIVNPAEFEDKIQIELLAKELNACNRNTMLYEIDNNDKTSTIGMLADNLNADIKKIRDKNPKISLGVVCYNEASFPVLEASLQNEAISYLIAVSGCFINGDDYYYEQFSLKEHLMENQDKGKRLKDKYNIIKGLKHGRKLPQNLTSESENAYLVDTLSNSYCISVMNFDASKILANIEIPIYSLFIEDVEGIYALTNSEKIQTEFSKRDYVDYTTRIVPNSKNKQIMKTKIRSLVLFRVLNLEDEE